MLQGTIQTFVGPDTRPLTYFRSEVRLECSKGSGPTLPASTLQETNIRVCLTRGLFTRCRVLRLASGNLEF